MRRWVLANLTSKQQGRTPEILIRTCPHCRNSKWHAYFNFEKGRGFCQRNGCKFGIESLMAEVYGPLSLPQAAQKLLDIEGESAFDIVQGDDRVSQLLEAMKRETPKFIPKNMPDGFVPFTRDISHPTLDYILTRNLPESWIYSGLFGYCTEERFQHRVITLILDRFGKPALWQGRSIVGEKPKYLYPSVDVTGANPSLMLFNECAIKKNSKLVLCEGAYSAIAATTPEFIGIASFAYHLSDTQKSSIIAHAPAELVLVCEPKTSIAKHQHRAIEFIKAGIRTSLLIMPEGDPESHRDLYLELLTQRNPL